MMNKQIPTLSNFYQPFYEEESLILPNEIISSKEDFDSYIKEVVKYTLEQVNSEQKMKFSAGETGYLNKESILSLEEEITKQLNL